MGRNDKDEGFIVHPFETGDNKYHASYGKNLNKTQKSFRTLSEAKGYLHKNKMKKALYDSPSGARTIKVNNNAVKRKKRTVKSGYSFFGL